MAFLRRICINPTHYYNPILILPPQNSLSLSPTQSSLFLDYWPFFVCYTFKFLSLYFSVSFPIGIYSTNTAESCAYITGHSKAGVVVLEGTCVQRSCLLPFLGLTSVFFWRLKLSYWNILSSPSLESQRYHCSDCHTQNQPKYNKTGNTILYYVLHFAVLHFSVLFHSTELLLVHCSLQRQQATSEICCYGQEELPTSQGNCCVGGEGVGCRSKSKMLLSCLSMVSLSLLFFTSFPIYFTFSESLSIKFHLFHLILYSITILLCNLSTYFAVTIIFRFSHIFSPTALYCISPHLQICIFILFLFFVVIVLYKLIFSRRINSLLFVNVSYSFPVYQEWFHGIGKSYSWVQHR